MFRRKKVFLAVLILVLIILGVIIGVWVAGSGHDESAPSGYSAVYMAQGNIYFGKLHWFPSLHLSDALVLQQTAAANSQQSGLSLVPFKNAFWGPVGDIYLNQAQVVFWAPIRSDSQVAQVIANPSLLLQNQPAAQQQMQQQIPPTTTPPTDTNGTPPPTSGSVKK